MDASGARAREDLRRAAEIEGGAVEYDGPPAGPRDRHGRPQDDDVGAGTERIQPLGARLALGPPGGERGAVGPLGQTGSPVAVEQSTLGRLGFGGQEIALRPGMRAYATQL